MHKNFLKTSFLFMG